MSLDLVCDVLHNVPRVVHVGPKSTRGLPPTLTIRSSYDLEICVPASELRIANLLLASQKHLFETVPQIECDIYTEHKHGCPRFRYLPEAQSFVVLFSDQQLGLERLAQTIIPKNKHSEHTVYSQQILDFGPMDLLMSMPMPTLPRFFRALCKTYCETNMAMYAIAAEQVVDAMDLDVNWCVDHMSWLETKELVFVTGLIGGKASRIDYFSSTTVTRFIANQMKAERVHRILGRLTRQAIG